MGVATLDFQSMNKSIINRKIITEKLDYKTMVFIVPRFVQTGIIRTELRFPHKGKIVDVYATCGVEGTTTTHVVIEKCSEVNYDTVPVWDNVFTNDLFIDANKKSSKISLTPYALVSDEIEPNDHFRINVVNAGEGVEDITVEIHVEISTKV